MILNSILAEREGFELSVDLHLRLISSPAFSASLHIITNQINYLAAFALRFTSSARIVVDSWLTDTRVNCYFSVNRMEGLSSDELIDHSCALLSMPGVLAAFDAITLADDGKMT
jgi:hypothetical protein